jgi:hypothetical protein
MSVSAPASMPVVEAIGLEEEPMFFISKVPFPYALTV